MLIKKVRTKPINLIKMELLLERIIENHTKKPMIERDIAKTNAGFKGEMSLDYHLTDLLEGSFQIFHDLRLPKNKDKNLYFQIDTLIVHSQFCALIEVKNLIGNLYFDHQYDQIIRTRDGIDETFSDPINQVELQKEHFSDWLSINKIPNIPLHTFVVITNPKSYIRISPKYGKKSNKIIRGNDLSKKVKGYVDMNKGTVLLKKELKKLASLLNKQHTQYNPNILKRYDINPDEIITGVSCPKCKRMPMIRIKRSWLCSYCANHSNKAHIKAVQDYALLFSPYAKNKDLRKFLHIESQSAIKKLLYSMNLKPTGSRKSAIYTLPLPK
jgi:ribosomal protein L37AE/L43A